MIQNVPAIFFRLDTSKQIMMLTKSRILCLESNKKKTKVPHKNRLSAVDLFYFAAIMPSLLGGKVGNGLSNSNTRRSQRAAQRFVRITDKRLAYLVFLWMQS